MIVKFFQAHAYRGPATSHPVYPATPRRRYVVGEIVDIPVDYFEQRLEPHGFARVHNAAAIAEGAAAALMDDMEVEQIRTLIEKHSLEDKVEATGEGGRPTREDMIVALDAHYKQEGRTVADEAEIPDDAGLARMRVNDLVLLTETRKLEVQGTGHDKKVLKADLVAALIERRTREETAKQNAVNLADRVVGEDGQE